MISGRNLILTDSVGRDLPAQLLNQDCDVLALPGFTIQRLEHFISMNPDMIKSRKSVLVHIGTNDIGSKQNFNVFMDFQLGKTHMPPHYVYDVSIPKIVDSYKDLIITILAINPFIQIILSSIIFRPFDYSTSKDFIILMNREIKKLSAKSESIRYLYTWKGFLDKHVKVPKTKCFSVRDQLHLSDEGTQILRDWFSGALSKFAK